LLVRLSEERALGVLLVSHDLGVVAQTCQRVVVLYAGQVVEEGPVERVLRHPNHPYTRALLDARPKLTGARVTPIPIPGAVPLPSDWPSGCRFHPRCGSRMDRCASEAPREREMSDGAVRCWLPRFEETPT
jgi:oligopeptide/dipeptide ABC transporter ATP-binding protein